MGNTIYASFTEAGLAEKAAGALLEFGVRPDDLSVVQGHHGTIDSRNYGASGSTYVGKAPNLEEKLIGRPNQFTTDSTSDLTAPADTIGSETEYDQKPYEADVEESAKHGISTTTGADAGIGAEKGLAWGTGIGIVAALASLAVPGFGLVAGGGALAMAIGGVVATAGAGAAAGAVTGYLKDQGVERHVADHYERTIFGGGAIVAVTVPSGPVDEEEARALLDKYGASSVNAYVSRGYLA